MEFNIPISDFNLLTLYSAIAFISMVIILIKFKNEKYNSKMGKQDTEGNCR